MWHLQLPVLLLVTSQVEGIYLWMHDSKGWVEHGKSNIYFGNHFGNHFLSLAAGATPMV